MCGDNQIAVDERFLHLPLEIIELIVSFIPIGPQSQSQLHALTLVSRSWHAAAVSQLYHTPDIHGDNFEQYLRAVCPSVNSWIRRNGLADLTRRLDLCKMRRTSDRNVTARLLGRMKASLNEFVAPRVRLSYVAPISNRLSIPR